MTNGIEEVDQGMLSTLRKHAGLGMALAIGIAIAGVLAVVSVFGKTELTVARLRRSAEEYFSSVL